MQGPSRLATSSSTLSNPSVHPSTGSALALFAEHDFFVTSSDPPHQHSSISQAPAPSSASEHDNRQPVSHKSSRHRSSKPRYPPPPPKGTFRSAHAHSVPKILATDESISSLALGLADVNPFVIPAPYGYESDSPLITPILDPPLSPQAWPEIAERRRQRRQQLKQVAERELPFSMFCRALDPDLELHLHELQKRPPAIRANTMHSITAGGDLATDRSDVGNVRRARSVNGDESVDTDSVEELRLTLPRPRKLHAERNSQGDGWTGSPLRRTLPQDELDALVQSIKAMGTADRRK